MVQYDVALLRVGLIVLCAVAVLGPAALVFAFRLTRYLQKRRALRLRAEKGPRCEHCGYSLLGVDLPRCPECGRLRGFDFSIDSLGMTEAELRAYRDRRLAELRGRGLDDEEAGDAGSARETGKGG